MLIRIGARKGSVLIECFYLSIIADIPFRRRDINIGNLY